jgi:hypothetical protein
LALIDTPVVDDLDALAVLLIVLHLARVHSSVIVLYQAFNSECQLPLPCLTPFKSCP